MRCHSQGLTIKLKKDIGLDELTGMIAGGKRMGEGRSQHKRSDA
jgi:hypothetical protein